MKGIAIIGFGVVGSGVYEIIKENGTQLLKSCGEVLKVKRIFKFLLLFTVKKLTS